MFEDDTELEYDVLSLNVGSKTKGSMNVPGVWENALTTRPINDLLGKIQRKEDELKERGVIPRVVVCGGGAAGVELSFAFKARWSREFGKDIDVTLISHADDILPSEPIAVRDEVRRKLKEKNIKLEINGQVDKITQTHVHLKDDRVFECDVPLWATGAEPQQVTNDSELDTLHGYFKVNDFMQSTSHPNIFAGGDCVCMESYADKPFPPKAGVYAVRAGPIVAGNIVRYIKEEPLQPYIP